MAKNPTRTRALLGGLLAVGGGAAHTVLDRKTRGMGKKKRGSLIKDGCGQCTAVHRAAKMLNNKKWNLPG